MSNKKTETIISLIEICENNLRTAKQLLSQISQEKGVKITTEVRPTSRNYEDGTAIEVEEGYFDGENMIGDNGKMYLVPQNYASKTQLLVGDRMKWIMTQEREIFKLIQPVVRERVVGTFSIEGDDYLVLVDKYPLPIKILKASATYAMKHLGLMPSDEVAINVPKDTTPKWGAFVNVVKSSNFQDEDRDKTVISNSVLPGELDSLSEFGIDTDIQAKNDAEKDYF